MKKLVLLFIIPVLCLPLNAQIKVAGNNNVGIQSESPVSKLSVGSNGSTYSKVYIYNSTGGYLQSGLEVEQALGSTLTYGIIGRNTSGSSSVKVIGVMGRGHKEVAYSSGRTYGVWGTGGNATSGYNHGLYGQLVGSNYGAAIFGATPNKGETYINNIYAGYFRGMVYIEDRVGIMTTTPDANFALTVNGAIKCNGFLDISSDERLKTDINPVSPGVIQQVTGLRGVTYMLNDSGSTPELIQSAQSDTGLVVSQVIYDNQSIYQRKQTGFLGQEMQQIFPDLVTTDDNGMLSINYIGLIPYLVEAIKEQQEEIGGLRKDMQEQQQEISKIRTEMDELRALIKP